LAKARIIDDELDEVTRQAQELAQLNEDEGGEVFRVADELRGTKGVELMIIRLTPAENAGYVGMMPVSEFTHENLARLYGPGHYKIRIQGPKGFLPGGGNVKIAIPIAGKAGGSGDFMGMLDYLEKRDNQRAQEKSDKLGRLAELSIPVIGSVLAALVSRNSNSDMPAILAALKPTPGPTLADLSTAMVNMRTLTQGEEKRDPIDSIIKVMEVVQNFKEDGAGSKGGSNWLDVVRDVIKEVGPAVGPVMENLKAAAAARASAQSAGVTVMPPSAIAAPPMPASAPTAAQPSAISAEKSLESEPNLSEEQKMYRVFKPIIKQHLSKVAKWAQEDKNPQTYAEVFIDEIPREFGQYVPQEKALEYLRHEKWFSFIVELEPTLTDYHVWCDEFRLEVIELLTMSVTDDSQHSIKSETFSEEI
jgi:hypothetical protein